MIEHFGRSGNKLLFRLIALKLISDHWHLGDIKHRRVRFWYLLANNSNFISSVSHCLHATFQDDGHLAGASRMLCRRAKIRKNTIMFPLIPSKIICPIFLWRLQLPVQSNIMPKPNLKTHIQAPKYICARLISSSFPN